MQLQQPNFFWSESKLVSLFPSTTTLVAIDEVGRGCLAGPVVACASVWKISVFDNLQSFVPFVQDSKKLSFKQRDACYELFSQDVCLLDELQDEQGLSMLPMRFEDLVPVLMLSHSWTVRDEELKKVQPVFFECVEASIGSASAVEIDEFNIWNATQIAMSRALACLDRKHYAFEDQLSVKLLVDGRLSIRVPLEWSSYDQILIVGGDAKFKTIGLSSILAKVTRDRFMMKSAERYPGYAFEQHKGYGTNLHRQKLKENDRLSDLHRRSFLEESGK